MIPIICAVGMILVSAISFYAGFRIGKTHGHLDQIKYQEQTKIEEAK